MRLAGAGFGLVALLIGVAIMFYLFTENTAQIQNVAGPARHTAERLAGRDENGVMARDSIKLAPFPESGKFKGLRVVALMPGGPMEKEFALQKDDVIIGADSHGLMNKFAEDPSMAQAWLFTSFGENRPIQVIRNNEVVLLDPTQIAQKNGSTSGQSAQPAQPAPATDSQSELQKQLQKITAPR